MGLLALLSRQQQHRREGPFLCLETTLTKNTARFSSRRCMPPEIAVTKSVMHPFGLRAAAPALETSSRLGIVPIVVKARPFMIDRTAQALTVARPFALHVRGVVVAIIGGISPG